MSSEFVQPLTLRGSCFCGLVSYEVQGKPVLSAYCHCTNCQRLTGCPFIFTMHYAASSFRWMHDSPYEDALDHYIPAQKWKTRARCKGCGSSVASYNARTERWSVWGVQLERDDGKIKHWDIIKPTAHIFYDTRVLDVNDGLGKWAGYEDRSERIL